MLVLDVGIFLWGLSFFSLGFYFRFFYAYIFVECIGFGLIEFISLFFLIFRGNWYLSKIFCFFEVGIR